VQAAASRRAAQGLGDEGMANLLCE